MLVAPVDEGLERRLEPQPAEEIVDVVTDLWGQLPDVPPDGGQIARKIVALVVLELLQHRVAPVHCVGGNGNLKAVAEHAVHVLAELLPESLIKRAEVVDHPLTPHKILGGRVLLPGVLQAEDHQAPLAGGDLPVQAIFVDAAGKVDQGLCMEPCPIYLARHHRDHRVLIRRL